VRRPRRVNSRNRLLPHCPVLAQTTGRRAPEPAGGSRPVPIPLRHRLGRPEAAARLQSRYRWWSDGRCAAANGFVPVRPACFAWHDLLGLDFVCGPLGSHDPISIRPKTGFGSVANQGKFYSQFDAVVLLSAPLDVMLERVASRESNPYGKTEAERSKIAKDLAAYEPLLRAGATAEIDTRKPLHEVVDELELIANRAPA
jgi:hypothetical protein